jgi:hypothetical protein
MKIQDFLTPNETILFQAQQHRLAPGAGKEFLPGQIFLTNQRIVLETTSALGLRKDYTDLQYFDVMEIEMKKNIFSSTLVLQTRFKGQIEMRGLGKNDCRRAEQIINEGRYKFNQGNNNSVNPGPQPSQDKKHGFWRK